MLRMRRRSAKCAAWIVALAYAGLPSLAARGQVLKQRHPEHTECPDTHLRLTARHPNGSPAAGLRKQDLYLWFSMGTADIRSMQSSEMEKPGAPDTGIPDTGVLLVVLPEAAITADVADAVLRGLRAVPADHWHLAVLAPDGSVTPFAASTNEAALRTALVHATASGSAAPSLADWPAAQRNAFRQLKARPGRHVIVELGNESANAFAGDRTLDLLARDDMAQIYRLATRQQLETTGGRTASAIDALFRYIAADAPGSYELVIHPLFSCQPGASYSLRITSFRPDVQLFYPSAIRMATAAH
jgi:hypothetical protein